MHVIPAALRIFPTTVAKYGWQKYSQVELGTQSWSSTLGLFCHSNATHFQESKTPILASLPGPPEQAGDQDNISLRLAINSYYLTNAHPLVS